MTIDCEKLKQTLNKHLGTKIINNNLLDIENEIKYNINIKIGVGKIVINSTNTHTKSVFLMVKAGKYIISNNKLNKKKLFDDTINENYI